MQEKTNGKTFGTVNISRFKIQASKWYKESNMNFAILWAKKAKDIDTYMMLKNTINCTAKHHPIRLN